MVIRSGIFNSFRNYTSFTHINLLWRLLRWYGFEVGTGSHSKFIDAMNTKTFILNTFFRLNFSWHLNYFKPKCLTYLLPMTINRSRLFIQCYNIEQLLISSILRVSAICNMDSVKFIFTCSTHLIQTLPHIIPLHWQSSCINSLLCWVRRLVKHGGSDRDQS